MRAARRRRRAAGVQTRRRRTDTPYRRPECTIRRRSATRCSSLSPAACPSRSLMPLNPSRSSKSKAKLRLLSFRPDQGLIQPVQQQGAIGEPGKLVVIGEVTHLRDLLLTSNGDFPEPRIVLRQQDDLLTYGGALLPDSMRASAGAPSSARESAATRGLRCRRRRLAWRCAITRHGHVAPWQIAGCRSHVPSSSHPVKALLITAAELPRPRQGSARIAALTVPLTGGDVSMPPPVCLNRSGGTATSTLGTSSLRCGPTGV